MSAPLQGHAAESVTPAQLRARIAGHTRGPEPDVVAALLDQARLPEAIAAAVQSLALRFAERLRSDATSNADLRSARSSIVRSLLQEFALSSQEGIALMCLAEALLRIPDAATRDALIRDKVKGGHWREHLGLSRSMFVNAATWGLLITGKLVATHDESGLGASLMRLVAKGGEPLIRKGVDLTMRMMGEQFVAGQTIELALRHAEANEAKGFRYSYDMLGEAAVDASDAARYLRDYEHAIDAIGRASAGGGVYAGPGISIKLSALHPRYSRSQRERVMGELYPRLSRLAVMARGHDIGINIDAEESDRLELSLDLLERLCAAPELHGWNGIGFVVQAYQKRCPFVIDMLIDLARRSGHRLMVRLVKGAYWDSEIKRAQVDGLAGYPVYTRKPYTDVAYIACARKLLAAADVVYPQIATHNAHTLAAVHQLALLEPGRPHLYEFQCLHGMGEPLYEQVVGSAGLGVPCRIYAPVGTHETLLAYLVRRLLENGANTSFVNRIADESIPLAELIRDPASLVDEMALKDGAVGMPHPAIALPDAIYGALRSNSRGVDLADEASLAMLDEALGAQSHQRLVATPLLWADDAFAPSSLAIRRNPAAHDDIVGFVQDATVEDVDAAVAASCAQGSSWSAAPAWARADILDRAALDLQRDMNRLVVLLIRESGKTRANAVSEVREAIDFLRFYAAQARRDFDNATHLPLGPVACISPWNFPLAIFMGQVSAALASGNTVLAKPAEQTPLIAAEAVRALWSAGVPRAAVQLLPGPGEIVGARLVADARVAGVMFTGSTDVARMLQRTLSTRLGADGRPIPLIAETGGQNALIVDSSALLQQVVGDVLSSAFDSAGQRCSALRVLCVQDDVADALLTMLEGAMDELKVGDPRRLATDVGPVIDEEARVALEAHVDAMRASGHHVYRRVARDRAGAADAAQRASAASAGSSPARGTFVAPTLIEITHLSELKHEVFGPVLHVLRFERAALDELLDRINATGYGLTLGLHTRIDETIAAVVARARVGNVYVNRNMVGAVVGVQPFGGEGLSGTGPKAGGPLYMRRLLSLGPRDTRALPSRGVDLPGPTGERNVYALVPREAVLCLAEDDADLLVQLAAVHAVGSRAVCPATAASLVATLAPEVRTGIDLVDDWTADTVRFDAVLHHGSRESLLNVCKQMADRPGPIVNVEAYASGDTDIALERLCIERSLSINTAAAGGNASLMSIG
ncbi:trifunctional transcriptional regulator/proline dehydrogenase/L-glutamate gamma-semialdehyde dehydrogenase [soil metagenome]